jgi:hypothetical protein
VAGSSPDMKVLTAVLALSILRFVLVILDALPMDT